ncbi:MAG: ParB/RepB/Spo0J family partition protein, partial [Rikenellaceae bacterium]
MKQKRGLGRGLNAIFNIDDTTEVSRGNTNAGGGSGEISQIAIPSIKPNPAQPRRSFDDDKLEELAESIKSLGVIQPITVRRERDAEEYIIISGERRWRAAQLAGL